MRVIMIGFGAVCAEATSRSRTLQPRRKAATRASPVSRRDLISPPRSLAERHDANRKDVAVLGWNGQPALGQQAADERGGLGIRGGRLYADAHEALGVVERLPGVPRGGRAELVGVAAAAIVDVEPRAALDEQLDGGVAPLERGAHQRGAPFVVRAVGIEAEV